jgi:hypothetical protein
MYLPQTSFFTLTRTPFVPSPSLNIHSKPEGKRYPDTRVDVSPRLPNPHGGVYIDGTATCRHAADSVTSGTYRCGQRPPPRLRHSGGRFWFTGRCRVPEFSSQGRCRVIIGIPVGTNNTRPPRQARKMLTGPARRIAVCKPWGSACVESARRRAERVATLILSNPQGVELNVSPR